MWKTSPTAQQVLTASHAIAIRATATTAALGVVSGIPVSGGQIVVDATSQVRRTGTVTVSDPTTYFPGKPLDILSPLGSELLVEYGIVIPGMTIPEWIPMITGVIQEGTRMLPTGDLSIVLADRSSKVAEDEFTSPTQIGGGSTTVVQAITSLVQHAYPVVVVIDKTGSSALCPVIDINKDRWADGVEVLATSIAAEVFFDPIGRLVIRPQPTLTDPLAWLMKTGSGGVVLTKTDSQKRENVYSQVIVSGMRVDGASPVYTIVQDTDPASPTYVSGPFGVRNRRFTSAAITTLAQANIVGAALLEKARGEQANVTLTTLPNPALDAGDVVKLPAAAGPYLFVLDKITTGLSPTAAQQLSTRSKVLPPEGS